MSADQEEFMTRTRYVDLVEPLQDADRALDNISRLAQERMLVTADELEFLVRRAQELVRACAQHAARDAGQAS